MDGVMESLSFLLAGLAGREMGRRGEGRNRCGEGAGVVVVVVVVVVVELLRQSETQIHS